MDKIHKYAMDIPIDGMNAETQEIEMHIQVGGSVSDHTAEAYAVGQRGGVPVGEDDPAYQNNAKYYAEMMGEMAREIAEAGVAEAAQEARADAIKAEGYATGTENGEPVDEDSPYHEQNAKAYAEAAAQKVLDAQGKVDEAANNAQDAEAWSRGTRGGAEVGPEDATYHQNSWYFSRLAQENQNQTARDVEAAGQAATAAQGAVDDAEAARDEAKAARDEILAAIVAAQGYDILRADENGDFYVLEDDGEDGTDENDDA